MREIARSFGISQYKTIAYQQSKNSIERLYYSLLEYLRHFTNKTKD